MAGAIATGSVISAALVHFSPWRPAMTLAVPYAVALVVVGFWAAYLVHTGFGSTFNSLVHARVDNTHRGTALSMTSMAFLGSAAAGSTALGLLADKTTPSLSLGVGVGCSLIAAALIATSTPRRKNAAKPRLSRANARNRDTNPAIAEQLVDTHGIRVR